MVPGSTPAPPVVVNVTGRSGSMSPSLTMRTSDSRTSEKATSSPTPWASVSCTTAMDRIRRTESSIPVLASGELRRRPCNRNSDEIVCRLFFTRW